MSKNNSINIPNDIPNGHERSYRRGYADAISRDKRNKLNVQMPQDLPNGHSSSYIRGYEDGKKNF